MMENPMKRTTVTLPQNLIINLMEVTLAKNKTQAVIGAVQDCIKRKKMETIKQLATPGKEKRIG